MSYFIKCISPSHLQGVIYAVRNGMPHKLNHPRSLDRDWFTTPRKAAAAKRRAERLFANNPITFRIERT